LVLHVSAFARPERIAWLLALIVALWRRRLQQTLGDTARLIVTAAANAPAIEHPIRNNRFAYAPAIAIGSMLAALGL
jgi:hypothetical protein